MSTKFKAPTPSSKRSTKRATNRLRRWLRPALITTAVALTGLLVLRHATNQPATSSSAADARQISQLSAGHGPVHTSIMTSVFWVGEAADSDNDYISNVPSAWDGDWQVHYGGYDNPDERSGYAPKAFTPQENPFYFALPYNDFNTGGTQHKDTASGCLPYTPHSNDHYSWCKNVWIAVIYGGKTVYAQWEDVGPNEEDDHAYVFGTAKPRNTFGVKAGLDVSPAVRDYLGLDGDNHTTWAFVPADQVPEGPWKDHVTSSLGYEL